MDSATTAMAAKVNMPAGSTNKSKRHETQEVTVSTFTQPLAPDALAHEIVKLFVGPNKKGFTVHRKLLCDRSPYFAAMLNRDHGFKEALEGVVYMPEDSEFAVSLLIDFLYRGYLPAFESVDNVESILFPLYCLAEEICLPILVDRVITLIISLTPLLRVVTAKATLEIFANTHQGSQFRRYAVESFTWFHLNRVTQPGQFEAVEEYLQTAEVRSFCEMSCDSSWNSYPIFSETSHLTDSFVIGISIESMTLIRFLPN